MCRKSIDRRRLVVLFVAMNSPIWVLYFVWTDMLRVVVIFLAYVAMWSLWVARRERKHLWTPKTHDIWLVQFLWCLAAIEGNIELFYRHARPSVAILLVAGILMLTIKAVFNGTTYSKEEH
jgi:hypothetical protein